MQSTLDALGKNPSTGRPAPKTLQHVILVAAATRGVTQAGYANALKTVAAAGAVVVDALAPQDAVAQFCAAQ